MPIMPRFKGKAKKIAEKILGLVKKNTKKEPNASKSNEAIKDEETQSYKQKQIHSLTLRVFRVFPAILN